MVRKKMGKFEKETILEKKIQPQKMKDKCKVNIEQMTSYWTQSIQLALQ